MGSVGLFEHVRHCRLLRQSILGQNTLRTGVPRPTRPLRRHSAPEASFTHGGHFEFPPLRSPLMPQESTRLDGFNHHGAMGMVSFASKFFSRGMQHLNLHLGRKSFPGTTRTRRVQERQSPCVMGRVVWNCHLPRSAYSPRTSVASECANNSTDGDTRHALPPLVQRLKTTQSNSMHVPLRRLRSQSLTSPA